MSGMVSPTCEVRRESDIPIPAAHRHRGQPPADVERVTYSTPASRAVQTAQYRCTPV
jgi:hypothetical protein